MKQPQDLKDKEAAQLKLDCCVGSNEICGNHVSVI